MLTTFTWRFKIEKKKMYMEYHNILKGSTDKTERYDHDFTM